MTTNAATTTTFTANPEGCPACNSTRINRNATVKGASGREYRISRCKACQAIFSETIYLGDSYDIVKPFLQADREGVTAIYFDFVTLGSRGLSRRHGWYDPSTHGMTQEG